MKRREVKTPIGVVGCQDCSSLSRTLDCPAKESDRVANVIDEWPFGGTNMPYHQLSQTRP